MTSSVLERISTRTFALFVFGLSLAVYLPGIGAEFFSTGEPREALVAQSMLLHRDPLISIRYDHDFATKPPLLHWLIAAAAIVIGEMNEVAARLPSVLFASFGLLFWFVLINSNINRGLAILSTLILGTTGEWYRYASMSRIDMVFSVAVLLGLSFLYLWHEKARWRYLMLAIVWLALAALAKGPVGVFLPLLITACWLILERELTLKKMLQLGGIGLVAIAPLTVWYFSQANVFGEQSLKVALSENYLRLIGKMSEGDDPHSHGMFYLLGVFVSGLLPWSLLGVAALVSSRDRVLAALRYQGLSGKRFIKWCAVSVTIFTLIFLIPESKRSVYLLPIYPQAAVLLALVINSASCRGNALAVRITSIMLFMLSIIIVALLLLSFGIDWFLALPLSEKTLLPLRFLSNLLQETKDSQPLRFYVLLSLLPISLVAFSCRMKNKQNSFLIFGAFLLIVMPFIKLSIAVPYASALSPKDFIATELRDHSPSAICMHSGRMYSEVFYLRMLNPSLDVHDCNREDSTLLVWADDLSQLEGVAYSHLSAEPVEKPNRRISFVRRM